MKQTPFPFRWVLPIVQLIFCALLLWSWRYVFVSQLHSAAHAYWPAAVEKQVFYVTAPVPPETPLGGAAPRMAELRLTLPALLNLPSLFFGLGIRSLVPKGMLSVYWHSISWPLFGVVFWWITGRGIEALVASRSGLVSPRISWVETLVALWVIILSGVVATGIVVDPSWRLDLIFPWMLGLVACLLWIFLGAVTVLARFLQWRTSRKMKLQAQGQTGPA